MPESLQFFFKNFSLVSYIIIACLALMSCYSWTLILYKFFHLKRVKSQNRKFLLQYEKKKRFSEIQQLAQNIKGSIYSETFLTVYNEFNLFRAKVPQNQELPPEDVKLLGESMERAVSRCIIGSGKNLESFLSIIATSSSSAPFIGLLGTVIGITLSFRDIASSGATSIAIVAPGISEALVATALGIFVAIPALVAFNLFKNAIRAISADQRVFGMQLINRLIRASRWNQ